MDDDEIRAYSDTIADIICGAEGTWRKLFIASIVFLVLGLFALPFLSPGSASYAILIVDFTMIGATAVVSGAALAFCASKA